MARPTDGPLFAKGGGNPSTWPAAVETNGYPYRAALPAEDLNGIIETLGDWIDHLRAGGHETVLETAVAEFAAGESFVLAPAGAPYEHLTSGQLDQNGSPLNHEVLAVACDAERVYVAINISGTGTLYAWTLDTFADFDVADAEWSAALTGTDKHGKIVSNGTYVAYNIRNEDNYEVLDASTGAAAYGGSIGTGEDILDIAMTESYLCLVGTSTLTSDNIVVVDLSDGSTAGAVNWGSGLDVYGVCPTADDRFFVAAGADGSSNRLGLFEADGTEVWRAGATSAPILGTTVASNGRVVLAHTGAELTAYSPADGAVVWTKTHTCDLPYLNMDAKDAFLGTDHDGDVYVVDPDNGSFVAVLEVPGTGGTYAVTPASNSNKMFLAYFNGTLGVLRSYATGLRARRWTRESVAPHFNQASPEVL